MKLTLVIALILATLTSHAQPEIDPVYGSTYKEFHVAPQGTAVFLVNRDNTQAIDLHLPGKRKQPEYSMENAAIAIVLGSMTLMANSLLATYNREYTTGFSTGLTVIGSVMISAGGVHLAIAGSRMKRERRLKELGLK